MISISAGVTNCETYEQICLSFRDQILLLIRPESQLLAYTTSIPPTAPHPILTNIANDDQSNALITTQILSRNPYNNINQLIPKSDMRKSIRFLIVILALLSIATPSSIHATSPPELVQTFSEPINAHLSPIGYRPLSGKLEGIVLLADPIGACSKLKAYDYNDNEDVFILADDTQCLESIKAKNIAASGGYVGIIKQNINNTLHDKQINLVHIPILQIAPEDYQKLKTFVQTHTEERIGLSIVFTDKTQTHLINVEAWFSPTEQQSYQFLLSIKDFLQRQGEMVSFKPHYVLQSQRESKNYIGCLSSGRYCPTEIEFEGKYEGKNIVQQTLRQIVIWNMSPEDWWKYMEYFYKNCLLLYPDIFLNTTKLSYCSQNSQIMAGIDTYKLLKQYNSSFLGNRKQVDDNTLLLEQRQHYIRQQITSHPTILINKKPIQLNLQVIHDRICKMQGDNPTADCTDGKSGLTTTQILILISVILAVFIGIAALYRLYIHLRMRRQIKTEVEKTLEQYYRYIETFEGQNGEVGAPKKEKKKEKFRNLTEELQQVNSLGNEGAKKTVKEVQMQNVAK